MKMFRYPAGLVFLMVLSILAGDVESYREKLRLETAKFLGQKEQNYGAGHDNVGTRWAILIAGSLGYENYRHQADVCHAYQILKQGGLKDENIIVFMYDDIAYAEDNPRPGVIINSPHSADVYKGVPKDYTGDDVTAHNFYAVILGNKTALTGGSGKVVDSGPNDRIFVFYSDHGSSGVLGMPAGPLIYAHDLLNVLKKKHESGTYKSLVFYVEACEAGSIFEGILPQGLNIYATTASNAKESSWAAYCPEDDQSDALNYNTCLGDVYSVAWIEDSERRNFRNETLHKQYELVTNRSAHNEFGSGSHVMEYGDLELSKDNLSLYFGTNPASDNAPSVADSSPWLAPKAVKQRDADLLHFWNKFLNAPEGSRRKFEAQKRLTDVLAHRVHVDNSIYLIGKMLFGINKSPEMLTTVRPPGHPLVDDWDCLKALVKTFETHCGSLSQYGMKHMRSIANLCNAGIKKEQMDEASAQACFAYPRLNA